MARPLAVGRLEHTDRPERTELRRAWNRIKWTGGLLIAGLMGTACGARSNPYGTYDNDAQVERSVEVPWKIVYPTFRNDAGVDAGADAGIPADNRWIVFTRQTEGGYKLFVWRAEDSALAQITFGLGNYSRPTWCVMGDAVSIIAQSFADGLWRLTRQDIDLDGLTATEPVPITTGDGDELHPQCTTSGRVYYNCMTRTICSINADGTGFTSVWAPAGEGDPWPYYPSPALDESALFMEGRVDSIGENHIYKLLLANGIGGTLTQLTFSSGDFGRGSAPSVSYALPRIVFTIASNIDVENGIGIAMANSADGSDSMVRVSDEIGSSARFSRPDGEWVVFSYRNPETGTMNIGKMNARETDPPKVVLPSLTNDNHPEMYSFEK